MRQRQIRALAVVIKPPFERRAKVATARSISAASRRSIGLTSMPSGGATACITANWPMPDAAAASRRTAARVTSGATCFSSSSHFPAKLYSNAKKPVTLPPGRAKLAIYPEPTGSTTLMNTIGTSWISCSNGPADVSEAKMMSGASATNSAAYWRSAIAALNCRLALP
jgi:hypothetical protein